MQFSVWGNWWCTAKSWCTRKLLAASCIKKIWHFLFTSTICSVSPRHYPQILQNLSTALSREDNDLALDNITAALARLILTNASIVPIDQVSSMISLLLEMKMYLLNYWIIKVFPAIMRHLPLREDVHEYTSIMKMFMYLFQNGHPLFCTHLPQIFSVLLAIRKNDELEPGNRMELRQQFSLK